MKGLMARTLNALEGPRRPGYGGATALDGSRRASVEGSGRPWSPVQRTYPDARDSGRGRVELRHRQHQCARDRGTLCGVHGDGGLLGDDAENALFS